MPGSMPFMPRIILPFPLRESFHHFLHLLELIQQAVDFLHRHAGAAAMRRLREALSKAGLRRSAGSWN